MAEEKKEGKTKRPTAKKRDLQNERKRLHNRSFKSSIKTAIRSYEETAGKENLGEIFSLIDKGVKRGIFKVNKASRLKSKFASKV